MKYLVIFVLSLMACQSRRSTEVMLHTSLGDIRVRLHDSTPRHRDNFLKLVREGFYDSLTFHRIERDVAVQGGDPSTRAGAVRGPADGPGYTVPAEIGRLPLRGALCAVRSPAAGQSHGSQFFFVPGFFFTETSMAAFEKKAGHPVAAPGRDEYLRHGGAPWLEGQVTVFGQVTDGIEVLDRIAALPRDENGRPLRAVYFTVVIKGN